MAGIFQIPSVELTRVIHNENFWNAVRIPIVSDARKPFPKISLWADRVFQTLHDREIAWRIKANIEPKNHLRMNAHHPGEVSPSNRQHHHSINDKEIKDRVIAFDSFKWSGWSWS